MAETRTIVLGTFAAGTSSWTPDQDYVLTFAAANKTAVLSFTAGQTTSFADGATEVVANFFSTANLYVGGMRHPIPKGQVVYLATSAGSTYVTLVLEIPEVFDVQE